jgi:hypothetical protein
VPSILPPGQTSIEPSDGVRAEPGSIKRGMGKQILKPKAGINTSNNGSMSHRVSQPKVDTKLFYGTGPNIPDKTSTK